MKRCPRCKQIKTLNEFNKNRSKKDGLTSYCRQCMSEKHRQYRQQNKDKLSLQKKRYYQKNKEKIILKASRYYQIHKDSVSLRKKHYQQQNRERISLQKRDRYYNPLTDKQFIRRLGNKQYMAYSSGGRHAHDVIAEKALGRRLKKGEVIHHHDGNGLNNKHNNLLICTRGYHTSLHGKIKAQALQ